ncbi:MAG TPA: hypothetical protein VLJ59_03325 [Mycobacteriales bacterium]|nr:hypothetical protein [Mycobacteriales bacterium]
MNTDELSRDMLDHPPAPGEMVYVERRGQDYTWLRVDDGAMVDLAARSPDAWIFYTGDWPDDPDRWPAFFTDLLAELESMTGGADRCRWSLDDPWPHGH